MRLPKKVREIRRELILKILSKGDRSYSDEDLCRILFEKTGYAAHRQWLTDMRREAASMRECLEDAERVSELLCSMDKPRKIESKPKQVDNSLSQKVKEAIDAWVLGDRTVGVKLIELSKLVEGK